MLVDIKKLENEPIIVVTYSDDVTAHDISQMFRQSADLMGDSDETYYRINDIRGTDSNFQEMLRVIQLASEDVAGSSVDPRISSTFVGSSKWMSFFRDAMSKPQYGEKLMAAFDTMEDALASVRLQIHNKQSQP